MNTAYLIVLGIEAIVCWYTVGLYVITQKNWWNPVAQVILVVTVSLALVFTWIFIARLYPRIPGRIVIGFSLFSLVMIATVWKAVVLTRLTRIIRRDKNDRLSKKDQPNP